MVWYTHVAPTIETGLTVGQRAQAILGLYAMSAWYLHAVAGQLQPGLGRFLLSLPVLTLSCLAPLVFHVEEEIMSRTSALFVLGWLTNFKVLAFTLNRGPLSFGLTLPQFFAALVLPIIPKPVTLSKGTREGRLQDHAGDSGTLLLRWMAKVVLLGLVVYGLLMDLPFLIRHALYCLGMYSFIGVLMDGPASLAMSLLGMELIPTFDQPWLSNSLADWWARRWNITTSSLLRMLVYDTVCDGALVKPAKRVRPSEARRLLGTFATFLSSALVHEVILWAVQPDGAVGWRWTTFFVLQAPMVVIENALHNYTARRNIKLNNVLRVVLTLAALEVLAAPFFFGAVEIDSRTADRVVRACNRNYKELLTMMGF